MEGTVSGLAPFGAFVDIGVGRDGLVHISELSEGRIEKVEDAVKVGDKVTVRVLEIDPASKRISLTHAAGGSPARGAGAARRDSRVSRAKNAWPRARIAARARTVGGARTVGRGRDATAEQRHRPRYTPRPRSRRSRSPATRQSRICFPSLAVAASAIASAARMRRKRMTEDRYLRRQRDAIRRTLQQMSDDE